MLGELYARELQFEAISARKMLGRIPSDKMDWKPHEKSMTLGRLAAHLTEILGYVLLVIDKPALDFADGYTPLQAATSEAVQSAFAETYRLATEKLVAVSDETLRQEWTMRNGDHVIFTLPRIAALRSFVFSHFIHHRGQLSVYLRMLDISVPSIYGPSADETA